MTTLEAVKLLEQLVEANMAQGTIKNFATLDKLREALTVLKNDNGDKKETGNWNGQQTSKIKI